VLALQNDPEWDQWAMLDHKRGRGTLAMGILMLLTSLDAIRSFKRLRISKR
jgi:hypothetical protein